MSDMLKSFLRDMLVRAVKTFCQTLLALIVADGAVGLLSVNWGDKFSVAGLAAVVSILTTIASGTFTGGSAAIGEAVTPTPQVLVKDVGNGPVAAEGSTIANDTPVTVTPTS